MQALSALGEIITHTPVWVFVLFAGLIGIGATAMRPRNMPLRRLFITPAVFIVWGLVSLVSKHEPSALLVGDWLITAAIGAAFGWMTTRLTGLRADRANGRVYLPGSPALMIRIVVVFLVKYAMGVAIGINPGNAADLAPWDVAVSGLMAGYFLGWLLRLFARLRTAPEIAPTSFAGATS